MRERNVTVAAACFGWLFSAVDIVLLILFQKQVAADLGAEAQAIRVAIGVGLLGSMLGGIVFAQLGDRFGRVKALGWSVVLYSLATAGMALAPNVGALYALRFVAGVGTGGEWSLGFALIAEVLPGGKRGTLGGLVAGMFNVGTLIAILLYQAADLVDPALGWRLAFGVMFIPAIFVSWLRRRVPESPVWLALQEARSSGGVDAGMEANLKRVPVSALFRSGFAGVTLKTTLLFLLMNFAFYGFSTTFINYLQFDASKGGLGLTPSEELPYQLTLNAVTFVSVIIAGTLSDRIGRRLTFSLFCVLGVAGYVLLYYVISGAGGGTPSGLVFVFAIVILAYGVNGIIGPLASELFPTHLRSTGPGFSQNIGKGIGGMAGPVVAGALVSATGFAVVLALPGVIAAALAVLVWILPAVGGREVKPVEDATYLRSKERVR